MIQQMLAKYIYILSFLFLLKYVLLITIKIFSNDLKPIKLTTYEEYACLMALSYIITYITI